MGQTTFHQKRKRLRARRITLICLAILLLAALIVGAVWLVGRQLGQGGDADVTPSTTTTAPTTTTTTRRPLRQLPADYIDLHTEAKRILLYDVSEPAVLYSKNADDICAPASLTKLMTAIVALENADVDTVLTAGNELHLLDPQSSRADIYIGHKLTLYQALQGLLMESGNDAAYIIAAQVGQMMDPTLSGQDAIDFFCQKMTEKAAELGCTNTTFLNPDGIDQKGHQTTANDLLKIALYAMDQPLIAEIAATEKASVTFESGQTRQWENRNLLLDSDGTYAYEGAVGLKTGTTDGAGKCLISVATRNGRTILCILLGAPTEELRWRESMELLDLGFFC